MNFIEILNDRIYNISNRNIFSNKVIDAMEKAYTKHKVSITEIVHLFYPNKQRTEDQVLSIINDLIRTSYRPKFHNIGNRDTVKLKPSGNFGVVNESASERYYKQDNVPEWQKLEHLLINHFYKIRKSYSNIGNRYIAIRLGYISEDESNRILIEKASRKVSDLLYILKEYRGTIQVEQKYYYGQKGSYHLITADWDKISDLYRLYDDKTDGSIRLRKSVRYRIISLLRFFKKNFSENPSLLDKLLAKQKYKYLKGLVQFKESDAWNVYRQVLFDWLHSYSFLGHVKDKLNTRYIVPNFNGKRLLLKVKDKDLFNLFTLRDLLSKRIEADYGFTTTIKPIF